MFNTTLACDNVFQLIPNEQSTSHTVFSPTSNKPSIMLTNGNTISEVFGNAAGAALFYFNLNPEDFHDLI
jgi:hypothetical protein